MTNRNHRLMEILIEVVNIIAAWGGLGHNLDRHLEESMARAMT